MMKILMVSKALLSGAYHAKLDEMNKQGANITLVIPQKWGRQKPEKTSSPNYEVIVNKAVFHGKNHFHYYSGLFNKINFTDFDLIHIDEEHFSFVTYQILRLAIKNDVRSIFFTWQNINKKYPPPFCWTEEFVLKNADGAIAGNKESSEILKEKGIKNSVAVIPQFGVDENKFMKNSDKKRSELNISKKDFVIGYAGRFVREKGISDILKAVKEIVGICNYKILLIGSGPEEKYLVEESNKYGIRENLIVKQQVESEKMPSYFNCMDCLVLPSWTLNNWKEQFGRVLIEAMACEVPVIGSDSGEIPNVIGDSGIIFKEKDVNSLADAINSLWGNSELRERFAQKARARVLSNFTQKIIASKTIIFYEQVLGA
jgi:glycosyltransferase involved in cell wall biosynthesis